MGVNAIDDINRKLKDSLVELKQARLSKDILHFKRKDADAIIYTIQRATRDFDYLSEQLYRKGVGQTGILSALKKAFNGLFGGF